MPVHITNEEMELFNNNGISKERMQENVDCYRQNGLSDDEIRAKIDNKLAQYTLKGGVSKTNYNPFEFKKEFFGNAFTPSKFIRNSVAIGKTINDASDAVMSPEGFGDKTFNKWFIDKLNENRGIQQDFAQKHPIQDKVVSTGTDWGIYYLLPFLRNAAGASALAKAGTFAGNAAIQGGIPFALESASNGNNPLVGGAIGTGIAAGIQGAYPIFKLVPWLAKNTVSGVYGFAPETIQQAIKPNSQALELGTKEAQRLLANTTERVRNTYKSFVDNAGDNVQDAINQLRKNEGQTDALSLMGDVNSTFEKYSGKNFNPARKAAGKLEDDLYNVISQSADETGNISPIDLQKIKEYTGTKTIWNDSVAEGVKKYNNPIVEQIYGKFNERLNNISPELEQANRAYEQLMNYKNNEGVRRVLMDGDKTDAASQALLNYDKTITKGNTGRNIQDLEQYFINNGEEPFLNTIDDIKAAQNINEKVGTGLGALTDTVKKLTGVPILKATRAINRTGIPENLSNFGNAVNNIEQKYASRFYRMLDAVLAKSLNQN